MGPILKKRKKKSKEGADREEGADKGQRRERKFFKFFFSLHFFLRFTEIGSLEFVGRRTKVLYETRATRGYQKHGISPRIQVKIREILIFSFSQIYGVLMVRIFRIKS